MSVFIPIPIACEYSRISHSDMHNYTHPEPVLFMPAPVYPYIVNIYATRSMPMEIDSHNLFTSLDRRCITPNVKEITYPLTNTVNTPISYYYSLLKKNMISVCKQLNPVSFRFARLCWLTFAAWLILTPVVAQDGLTRFYYPDGTVSSEGTMRNGRPDGYWKTYYPGGILKSEGNRVNFMLDSVWVFYREDGTTERSITYREDVKNGVERSFDVTGKLSEEYTNENNIRQGPARAFYPSGELWKTWQFVNNKEEGKLTEYAKDGRVITLITYRNGFMYASEKINRYDESGQRTGTWKDLYPNQQIKEEGNWTSGKRNGVFKFYDRKGFLEKIEKYVNGELATDVTDDTSILDIRREYDENGRVRSVGSYREGKKHGTFRKYDENGKEIAAELYEADVVTGTGLVDSLNRRQGPWKLFYPDGKLRAEGSYINGLREGAWTFFFLSGKVEQKGSYKEDLPTGQWNWFFRDGSLHRDETYRRGKEDGHAVEYDSLGNVINEGDYVDGLKSGQWKLTINDHTEQGEYVDGERNGNWVWYYENGNKAFEGEFAVGIPVGKHKYWHHNGVVKMKGAYEAGELDGPWQYFDETGLLIVETEYDQGRAVRINGQKIKLPVNRNEEE
jgi:uncharacterized protein